MAGIKDLVTDLLLKRAELPKELCEEVVGVFRTGYFNLHRLHKGIYIRDAMKRLADSDCPVRTHRDVAKMLGYGPKSSGAIDAAMQGSISDEKFELFRQTVARQLKAPPHWPSAAERLAGAQMATISYLVEKQSSGGPGEAITQPLFDTLLEVLNEKWLKTVLGTDEAKLESDIRALLERVGVLVESEHRRPGEILHGILRKWGHAYLLCKHIIPGT